MQNTKGSLYSFHFIPSMILSFSDNIVKNNLLNIRQQDVKSLVTLPGMHTNHTLLNVVRSRGPGRIRDAVVIDNLETKPDSIISKGIVGQVSSALFSG